MGLVKVVFIKNLCLLVSDGDVIGETSYHNNSASQYSASI